MRRILAIMEKEFHQIKRDPLSLGLLAVIPALLIILYGYALSFDVKHIRLGVLDRDRTRESRMFLDSLFQNQYFDRARNLERVEEADGLLARGDIRGALIIPGDYAKKIHRGEEVAVQLLIDGGDATTASTAIGYLDVLAGHMTARLRGPSPLPVVSPEPRIWFNPDLESAKFLIPGVIGMLLMLSAVVATSLSIVREKERETMEQMMVSPLRSWELIVGKSVPYILIGLVTMTLILIVGYLLFGIVIRGSFPLLGTATILFLFAVLGMGVLISTITSSQQVAFQIAVISSLLPSLILSGLVFPIRNMPVPIQAVSLLLAPRYFVHALRGIILKGASLPDLWPNFAALFLLGCLFNLLAIRGVRKEL